jgi:hypothetical protein
MLRMESIFFIFIFSIRIGFGECEGTILEPLELDQYY